MKNKKFTKTYQIGLLILALGLGIAFQLPASGSALADEGTSVPDKPLSCVSKRFKALEPTTWSATRNNSLLVYKNRLKQIDKLQTQIKNSKHEAVLQPRLEAAKARAGELGEIISGSKDKRVIHQATCDMLYELRINSFWPAYLNFLKKTDASATNPGKLRVLAKKRGITTFENRISALEQQHKTLTNDVLALTPQSVPVNETTPNILRPYAERRSQLVKEANNIRKEIAAVPRKKISKQQVSKSGLQTPPNFSTKTKNGYYLLPASPGNEDYYIYTKTMPGKPADGGYMEKGSPDEERRGRKLTIDVFYTVALKYKAKYGDSKLVAGDLNAPGHATHKTGINMDIYSSGHAATLVSKEGGNDARSIELAKMLIDTGHIDSILFNDPDVIREVNKYAKRDVMRSHNKTHDYHFHITVK